MGRVCMVRDLVAELVMGRVCYGPSLSWAEFVMGRDVPESVKTYLRRVVSLSKDTFTPGKVLVIPRKWWLRPHMTKNCLLGRYALTKPKKHTVWSAHF